MAVGMDDLAEALDLTRPMVLGYVRAHLLMTEPELAALKQDLALFARSEGYTLGAVYVERIDRIPAAFGALVEAVERDKPAALVVPSVLHLVPLGPPPQLMRHLETTMGVRILMANSHSP